MLFVDSEHVTMSARPQQRADPSIDRLLRLLSNGLRRRLLVYLSRQADEPVPLDELRLALLADDRVDVSSADRLETELFHAHLPALADAGLVSTNESRSTVRYHGGKRVDTLLESVEAVA